MSDKIKLVVTSNRLHLLLMANRWPTMSVHQECAYLQEHSSDTCCFRVRGYYPGIYDGGGGSYQFIFNLTLLTQSMVNALDSNLCSLKSEKCSSNNITTKWFGVWNCCWCREVTSGFRATDFFFFFFFFPDVVLLLTSDVQGGEGMTFPRSSLETSLWDSKHFRFIYLHLPRTVLIGQPFVCSIWQLHDNRVMTCRPVYPIFEC